MKRWLGLGFILLIAVFLVSSHSESADESNSKQKPDTHSAPVEQRKPNSDQPPVAAPITSTTDNPGLAPIIQKLLPTQAPANLKDRWSHVSNFEDDRYLDTQMQLDGRPVEGYIFKWMKDDSGKVTELVAGTLPRVESINGSFPSPAESQRIVDELVGQEGEALSQQEVWNLNSSRVLSPQIKVEVQTKSRDGRRGSGHEYWFISLNSGEVVKRVEADRY